MNIPCIIFLSLFLVVSVAQLFFCFFEKEKARMISKPFCVFLLGLAALSQFPDKPFIYIGAFLGAIGDVFLLFNKKKWCFFTGTIVFALGHASYLVQIILSYSRAVPTLCYILIPIGILIIGIGMLPFSKKMSGWAGIPGNFYAPFLILMLVASIFLAVDMQVKWPGILMSVGYVIFIASDLLVLLVTFMVDFKRREFPVMITYLIAEFLIVFGLISSQLIMTGVWH